MVDPLFGVLKGDLCWGGAVLLANKHTEDGRWWLDRIPLTYLHERRDEFFERFKRHQLLSRSVTRLCDAMATMENHLENLEMKEMIGDMVYWG